MFDEDRFNEIFGVNKNTKVNEPNIIYMYETIEALRAAHVEQSMQHLLHSNVNGVRPEDFNRTTA